MKIGTNLILLGILSLLIGTAFASPLLISELEIGEIKPFPEPLPEGPTADISIDVLYANLSLQTNSERESLTDLSYFVVLNITNNSDDWAKVIGLTFDAETQNYTKVEDNEDSRIELGRGWDAEGAWVDGEWFNLTWVPNKEGFYGPFEPDSEGCWMEGVQIYELYVNYELAYTHMNMNGTWVDVTGRINVTRPPDLPPKEPVMDGTFFSEIKFFSGGTFYTPEVAGLQIPTTTPTGFSNLWAPHQSRLIALTNARKVPTHHYDPLKVEKLKTEDITFRTTLQSQLNGTTTWDSTAVAKETKQVRMEITEDGYLYNAILSDDQMFVMDSFGVEVFIEPRN